MGNTDNQIFLELWKGNLGSALKIAKEKEYLSETLVAMSVLGGYELYEETVQAYADQLASKEFYQTAATYYLAIHKVHEAIDMFRKQAMFKEAVALAKIRLAPNDPIINELQYAWGDKLLSEGSYEPAARCYLAAGREDDAIKVLAKKNDSNSLKTAARVALACDKDEKAESLSIQYAENLLLEMRWKEIHEFLTFSDKLQGTRFLSIVHELILQKLCKRQTLDPFKIPEIRKESHWAVHIDIDNLPDVLQKLKGSAGSQSHIQDKTNIVFHSSCIFWKAFGQMPSNLESYRTESNLNKASEIQMFVKSQKFPKVLLEISKLIANGILYILRGDSEKSFKCWLQAIHICSVAAENETVESLIQLCIPRWTLTVDSYLRFTETISASKRRYAANLLKNFNAFYMASALYKLWLSPDTEIESESNMNTSDLVQLNMETSNEIHEVKNQSEMDTAATDQDDRDSKIEDTSNSYAKLLTAMGQSGLNVKHKQDLLVTLSGISFSLLSDLDARVSVLKKQLEATEKELMEQEIKQRLKEHIESNRTKNTKSKPHMPNNDNIQSEKSDTPSSSSSAGVDSKLISRGDANGYDTSLTSLDDTSSEVAIVDSGVDVDEQTMMALLSKREAIKCELMHIPPEIKDYPFPSPLENAKIIICLCFRTENTGIPERRRQLESLAKDIAHWALRHATSVDESKYFVDVLSRIGEPGNE